MAEYPQEHEATVTSLRLCPPGCVSERSDGATWFVRLRFDDGAEAAAVASVAALPADPRPWLRVRVCREGARWRVVGVAEARPPDIIAEFSGNPLAGPLTFVVPDGGVRVVGATINGVPMPFVTRPAPQPERFEAVVLPRGVWVRGGHPWCSVERAEGEEHDARCDFSGSIHAGDRVLVEAGDPWRIVEALGRPGEACPGCGAVPNAHEALATPHPMAGGWCHGRMAEPTTPAPIVAGRRYRSRKDGSTLRAVAKNTATPGDVWAFDYVDHPGGGCVCYAHEVEPLPAPEIVAGRRYRTRGGAVVTAHAASQGTPGAWLFIRADGGHNVIAPDDVEPIPDGRPSSPPSTRRRGGARR